MTVFKTTRCRAVSVIELMVVVIILMIFSTLTIISYHNMSRGLATRSQANEINAVFVLARELAITNSTPHRVVFDQPNQEIWIDGLDATATTVDAPMVSGVEPYVSLARIERVAVNSVTISPLNQAEVIFNPDGTSDHALLHISQQGADLADDTEYATIILSPPTAVARIYPNERR